MRTVAPDGSTKLHVVINPRLARDIDRVRARVSESGVEATRSAVIRRALEIGLRAIETGSAA